jgi:hypothetical protein
MPLDNLQLSPAGAEARFQLLQLRRRWDPKADDPLFRSIDADDFRINGSSASDFSNLRKNGLIRISFPLTPNIRLFDPATNQPSAETFVDVWRAVPTVNDVALTGADGQSAWPRGPNATGGYQIDARFANLQEQARGALTTHAEIRTTLPQQLLNDLASFQRVLFTTPGVRNLADAVRTGTFPLPDPDPPLNDLEKGRQSCLHSCLRALSRRSRSINDKHPVGARTVALSRYRRPVPPARRFCLACAVCIHTMPGAA